MTSLSTCLIHMYHYSRVTTSVFYFFFSSRRRHTRFDCDWSSDVCSSDLFFPTPTSISCAAFTTLLIPTARSTPAKSSRSEEHTSELQSQSNLVCRLLLEKKSSPHRDHAQRFPSATQSSTV